MDIIGYEGLYKIYPDGRIWGCKRKKFRVIQTTKDGYKFINLKKNNIQGNFRIHRLLMRHYKPDEWDENLTVNHKNGVRGDNRLENLEMVSHLQNCQIRGMRKDNKSGHKNISYNKKNDGWLFQKFVNKIHYHKYFKRLDDAIAFKQVFCVIHNVKSFQNI
jgi:hypothetical protein